MTSATTPAPFAVTSKNFYDASFADWKAFDGNPATACASNSRTPAPWWIKIDLGSPKCVSEYVYQTRGDYVGNAWRGWTLEGSSDNVHWLIVDTRVGEGFGVAGDLRTFVCPAPRTFRYWKWNVTDSPSDYADVGSLELWGPVSDLPPSMELVGPVNMTSATTPSPYVASSSNDLAGYEALKAFDSNEASLTHSNDTLIAIPYWIKIDLGTPQYVAEIPISGTQCRPLPLLEIVDTGRVERRHPGPWSIRSSAHLFSPFQKYAAMTATLPALSATGLLRHADGRDKRHLLRDGHARIVGPSGGIVTPWSRQGVDWHSVGIEAGQSMDRQRLGGETAQSLERERLGMSYDFPASPAPDQEYTPPVGGQTYIYKPPRWLVKGIPPAGGGSGGGIDEAPVDGNQYAREDAAWSEVTIPSTDWADIPNKPATFPPTVPIPWTDVSGKPTTYPPTVPIAWTDVSGKPATYPPTVPISWANISGQPATYPPTLPIAQSDITNLTTDLTAKFSKAGDTMTGPSDDQQ